MAHEWGHEVLGPDYFAASNPSDPGHSPDPDSVMAARPLRDHAAVPVGTERFLLRASAARSAARRVQVDGHRCRVFLGQLRVKELARCVNVTPAQTLM